MSTSNYPEYHRHLQSLVGDMAKAIPGAMGGFSQLHNQALKEGALSTKVKELMSLAISICVRCDGCIAYHVYDALKAGATREEIEETVGVAVMMSGGPGTVYGAQALEALAQYEAEVQPA